MANIAESCTHVGALLFKIEAAVHIRGKKTVTDVPAYWKIPSGINKVHGEFGYKIDFTSAAAQRIALDRVISGNSPIAGLRTRASRHTPPATLNDLSSLLPVLHKHRAVCMSTMDDYYHSYTDPVQPAVMPKPHQHRLRDLYFDQAPISVLLQHCETVKDITAVTKEQADMIRAHTKQQHKASAWYGVRSGRVTASNMHAIVATNIEKPTVSTVRKMCYPTALVTTPDMRWGIEHEEAARSVYQAKQAPHHTDLKIELSGFNINPVFPQVGASPDGVLHYVCCQKGCLEIKCPAKHKNNTVQEACDGDRDFCLHVVGNKFQLKRGHRYYTPVQTQIFVTESTYCDFVVWTQRDLTVVRVMPDVKFWESCLQKAQEFFLKVSHPELVCRHYTQDASTTQPSRVTAVKPPCTKTVPQVRRQKKENKRKRTAENKENLWCLCSGPEELEDMVACDNKNCAIQWFHLSCVGLDPTTAAGVSWFCDACQ
ncbi:hypothetical protein ABVT39_009441 [Epinephelus coioides]